MNEELLGEALPVGISKAAVKELFGEPSSVMNAENGVVCFDYFFAHVDESGSSPTVVSGVTVLFRDDGLIRWSPIRRTATISPENRRITPVEPRPTNGGKVNAVTSCSLWIVSSNPVDGGRYVDTDRFPKLGYISNRPDLEIKRIKSLEEMRPTGNSDEKGKLVYFELLIGLADEDAVGFKNLTEKNLRKRILLMVGDRPVLAPYVIAPVATGLIRIPCDDSQQLKELKDMLANLLPAK